MHDSSGPHVALYGLFGITNLGNDATLEAALHNLREFVPDVRITCVAHEPEAVEERFDIPAVYISQDPKQPSSYREAPPTLLPNSIRRILTEPWRWWRTIRFLRTVDHLIMPGTGLLDDFGLHPLQHPYQLWKWTVAARLTRTPVGFLAIGAGPIGHDLSRWFFVRAARNARWRSFRDQESKDFTAGIGVDTADDEVVPDLVFRLPLRIPGRDTSPGDQVAGEGVAGEGVAGEGVAGEGVAGEGVAGEGGAIGTVGIGLIEYHSWRNREGEGEDHYRAYVQALAEFAIELLGKGTDVRLLTGQVEDLRAVDDFRRIVAERCPEDSHRVSATSISTIHDLFAEIDRTDAVVASRFHNVLCALILGKPVVSVGYASKNDRLMESFGLGGFCQFIWDLDLDVLRSQFARITADPSELRGRLEAGRSDHEAQLTRHFERVAGRIRSG